MLSSFDIYLLVHSEFLSKKEIKEGEKGKINSVTKAYVKEERIRT